LLGNCIQDKVAVIYSVGYPPRLIPAPVAPTRISEVASAARRQSGVGLVSAVAQRLAAAPAPAPAAAAQLGSPLPGAHAPAPGARANAAPGRASISNPYSVLIDALLPKAGAATATSTSGRRRLQAADDGFREPGARAGAAAGAPAASGPGRSAALDASQAPEWDGEGPLPDGWVLEPDSRGVRELGEQRRLLEAHAAAVARGRGLGEVARRALAAALVREASQYGRVSYVRPPPRPALFRICGACMPARLAHQSSCRRAAHVSSPWLISGVGLLAGCAEEQAGKPAVKPACHFLAKAWSRCSALKLECATQGIRVAVMDRQELVSGMLLPGAGGAPAPAPAPQVAARAG